MPRSPRSRILNSAADLFADRGFHAVGTREIARRAMVNESTVFRLFSSKSALANAVILRITDPVHSASIPRAIASSESLGAAAQIYSAWYAQHLNARTVRLWVVLAMENGLNLPVSRAHLAMVERIALAQQRGDAVEGDARSMLRTLHSALWGNAILAAIDHPIVAHGSAVHREVTTIVRIWLRGVLR